MIRACVWLLMALAVSSDARAEDVIYKCAREGGTVVFSDKPCAAAKDMQQVTIEPGPLPDITSISALCASELGARLDLTGLDRATLASLPAGQRASVNDALAEYARSGSRPGGRWGRGEDAAVHLCLPTFADEVVEYVATADGKLVQMRGGMVSYRNDPDTPAALLDRCASTWKQCAAVPDAKPDSCVTQVPTCAASEPWKGGRNCCPIECKTAYNTQRAAGVPGDTALMKVLYDNPSCVPGLSNAR